VWYEYIDGMPPDELAYVVDLSGATAGGDAATPRALILCDLLWNIPKTPSGISGVISLLFGSVGPLRVTRLSKLVFVKNKPALVAWLRSMAGKVCF
jgi:hypothetical protein